jgi:hypothetical protein
MGKSTINELSDSSSLGSNSFEEDYDEVEGASEFDMTRINSSQAQISFSASEKPSEVEN